LVWVFVSHPVVCDESQSAKPGEHSRPQEPPLHVGLAFARVGQALPQLPQLPRLVWTNVSQPFAFCPSQFP
jgi:hypothetical protein